MFIDVCTDSVIRAAEKAAKETFLYGEKLQPFSCFSSAHSLPVTLTHFNTHKTRHFNILPDIKLTSSGQG